MKSLLDLNSYLLAGFIALQIAKMITSTVFWNPYTNIMDMIVTGDFNLDVLGDNNNKIKQLMQQYCLYQLIQEPTHFTENT